MQKLKKFIPGIVWFLISFWLFTLPGSAIPDIDVFHKVQGDKFVHAFIFFLLGYLFISPIQHYHIQHKKRVNWFLVMTILFMLYGIAVEFIQKNYIPFRSFDIGDIFADIVGSLLALWYAIKVWGKEVSASK